MANRSSSVHTEAPTFCNPFASAFDSIQLVHLDLAHMQQNISPQRFLQPARMLLFQERHLARAFLAFRETRSCYRSSKWKWKEWTIVIRAPAVARAARMRGDSCQDILITLSRDILSATCRFSNSAPSRTAQHEAWRAHPQAVQAAWVCAVAEQQLHDMVASQDCIEYATCGCTVGARRDTSEFQV